MITFCHRPLFFMSYHLADQKPIVYLFSPHTPQSGSTSAATPTMTPPASFPSDGSDAGKITLGDVIPGWRITCQCNGMFKSRYPYTLPVYITYCHELYALSIGRNRNTATYDTYAAWCWACVSASWTVPFITVATKIRAYPNIICFVLSETKT